MEGVLRTPKSAKFTAAHSITALLQHYITVQTLYGTGRKLTNRSSELTYGIAPKHELRRTIFFSSSFLVVRTSSFAPANGTWCRRWNLASSCSSSAVTGGLSVHGRGEYCGGVHGGSTHDGVRAHCGCEWKISSHTAWKCTLLACTAWVDLYNT